MHSCVYVIIKTTGNIETAVAHALAPFDEDRAVRPYKLHLSANSVAEMARHYNIPETDHAGLIAKMNDWLGYSGGKDHLGFYAMSSNNPDGKWDWYEIGGRFNGRIRGIEIPRPEHSPVSIDANTISASELLQSGTLSKRLPFAVVTPHSLWIERTSFISTSTGWYVREEKIRSWQQRISRILRTFLDHRVVCVDAHY